MSDPQETAREDSKVSPPIVDLLKRHATLPSRQLILSEAFDVARRLQSSGSRTKTTDAPETAES